MTTSNSQIFTTQVFGNSSGLTAEEQATKDTEVTEQFYGQYPLVKMNTRSVTTPSNQRTVKGK
jgi:hypothetical protein